MLFTHTKEASATNAVLIISQNYQTLQLLNAFSYILRRLLVNYYTLFSKLLSFHSHILLCINYINIINL